MLPLFHEYRIDHPRFRGHARVAYIMAMVAPVCAIFFLNTIGWWNPWLWAGCAVGLALALALYSVIALHRNPRGISRLASRLVASSEEWFPCFFAVIQSSIAALILVFLWFSISALALNAPLYIHFVLTAIAILIPVRRYTAARAQQPGAPAHYPRRLEQWRAAWHILVTIFLTRSVIGLTITDLQDTSTENIAWQIICWVPALLYIIFVIVLAADHLRQNSRGAASGASAHAQPPKPDASAADRF